MRNFSKNTKKRFKKLAKDGEVLKIKILSNGGRLSDAFKGLERIEKITDLGVSVSIQIDSSGGYIG